MGRAELGGDVGRIFRRRRGSEDHEPDDLLEASPIGVMTRSVILLFAGIVAAQAHDIITTKITWSREISRLVYKRCSSCHREGGSSFSLMTYAEARPWAKAIKEEVLERRMPPWGAVKGFGDFQNDQGFTQEQLELVADWVEGGAPEGDPKFLPKTPDAPAAVAATSTQGIVVDGELT